MKRHGTSLLLSLVLWSAAVGQEQDARLLENAVQLAIQRAEPGIACILVSRSPLYRDYDTPDVNPALGRLGSFEAPRREFGMRPREDQRERELRALDLANPENPPESYGSGVVLDRSGLVLTCAHVVQGATKVFVRLPGGAGSYANIHALDGRTDLAVLKLITPLQGLKPVELGEADQARKGQFVIALANPFASGQEDGSPSASLGIVSNLRRRLPGFSSEIERNRLSLHQFGTLLQTDARLNLGCSGGALLNLKGQVIGILSSKAALVGVETPGGFAIPLTSGLRRVIEILQRGEEVEYGFLGVSFRPENGPGVRIFSVTSGSPAWKAGLRPDDYLLAIGGMRVRRFDDVFLALGMQLAGSTVEVERARALDGPRDKVSVVLGKYFLQLPWLASNRPPARGGLRVDHTSVLVQRFQGDGLDLPRGVLVREVVAGSAAAQAGLQVDRVITRVDNQPVTHPREFYQAMARARNQVVLTLQKADGGTDDVTLALEDER